MVMVEGTPVGSQIAADVEDGMLGEPGTRLTLHVKRRGKGQVRDRPPTVLFSPP